MATMDEYGFIPESPCCVLFQASQVILAMRE